MTLHRRTFLIAVVAGLAAGHRGLLAGTTPGPATQGLTSLLLEADRERLLEALAGRINAGLQRQELLAALAEAAPLAVAPYPQVGFKYHAFMVLHAVERSMRLGVAADAWLPPLWAADLLKASQAAESRRGDWQLAPVPSGAIPASHRAEAALRDALERWDPEAADAAVVGMLRTHEHERLFAMLFAYGARDFRAIGHKAITVANCHRLAAIVPTAHLEPMLRSAVLALLNHGAEPNPATSDLAADRPGRRNRALLADSPQAAGSAPVEVSALLAALREGTEEDASRAMWQAIACGTAPEDLWTAVFAAAGDLMLKQAGIFSVHANTTADALHHAWRHTTDPQTRHFLLLQAAAFLPLFRELIGGDRSPVSIETLAPSHDGPPSAEALDEAFATLADDRIGAARKVLAYLSAGGAEPAFVARARHYVVRRTQGYHDYKLAEAAFANATAMSAPWRNRYLAAITPYLNGPADPIHPAVARVLELPTLGDKLR
jgi:hypothetical protein